MVLDTPFEGRVDRQDNWRIIRGPRVLTGETPLQLPQSVAIDIRTNAVLGAPLPVNPTTGNIDILFSPSGSLTGRGLGSNTIQLWLRDVTKDDPLTNPNSDPGEQIQISFVRFVDQVSTASAIGE